MNIINNLTNKKIKSIKIINEPHIIFLSDDVIFDPGLLRITCCNKMHEHDEVYECDIQRIGNKCFVKKNGSRIELCDIKDIKIKKAEWNEEPIIVIPFININLFSLYNIKILSDDNDEYIICGIENIKAISNH